MNNNNALVSIVACLMMCFCISKMASCSVERINANREVKELTYNGFLEPMEQKKHEERLKEKK